MTDLERKIREAIGEFCSDMCARDAEKVLISMLELHRNGDDGHMCVKTIVGYSVQAWYGNGEDCPTVVAIGRGLGVLGEGGTCQS